MERLTRTEADAAKAAYEAATGHRAAEILYRDDHDTAESSYQVVDEQGHGDGSGIWTPIKKGWCVMDATSTVAVARVQ